jgi:hypothetical protein
MPPSENSARLNGIVIEKRYNFVIDNNNIEIHQRAEKSLFPGSVHLMIESLDCYPTQRVYLEEATLRRIVEELERFKNA